MWNIKAYCLCDKSSRARMVWGSDVKQVAASTEAVSADGGEIGKRKDEFVFVISFHILRVFVSALVFCTCALWLEGNRREKKREYIN